VRVTQVVTFDLVVLDPAGRICFSNAQASAWVTDGDTVCRLRDGLSAPSRAGREALDRLIRNTLADASAGVPSMPRVVPLPRHGRLPLVAVGLPITRSRSHSDFELGAAILLRDPEVVQLPPERLVREMFQLTQAEAQVALALAGDRSLKEIALDRACSVNTVRTLVGRVFLKTGCRRQSEVVRVVGALNDVLAASAGLASGLAWTTALQSEVSHRAVLGHYDELLRLPLRAPPNQHATIVSRSFAPGDDTGYHLDGCGHEIVCILEGTLTMEYLDRPMTETAAGEAVYVPPGVAHRGVNTGAAGALSLFHVGIGPAGSIDRRNL